MKAAGLLLLAIGCGKEERPIPDLGDGADDSGAPLPDEVALSTLTGAPADGIGSAVAAPGDFDGDGVADLAVGGWLGNLACVAAGPPAPTTTAEATCFTGEGPYDYAGYALGPAGDLDGDGRVELLVGAVGYALPGANAGRVYLLGGGSPAGSLATARATFTGEAANDYAGAAFAMGGDLTGDGVADLLIGAPGNDNGGAGGGRSYLLAGPLLDGDHALAASFAIIEGSALAPPHGAYGTGQSVGNAQIDAGDLDGDGLEDLAVGAYGGDALGPYTGLLAVFRGPVGEGTHLLVEADATLSGEVAGAYAGSPLVAAGDLDGDGAVELLVSQDGVGTGAVSRVDWALLAAGGDLSAARGRLVGDADGERFGAAVAVGELGGVWSVAVGAPAAAVPGPEAGAVYVFDDPGAEGVQTAEAAILSRRGEAAADQLGLSVAIGAGLFVVGAPNADAGGGFSGRVYTFAWPG